MYDVIVIGGGIIGSYIASAIEDLEVLLIEKTRKIHSYDSGIVSKDFEHFFSHDYVLHEINEMEFISPSGKTMKISTHKPFAFVIDKEKIIKTLRKGVNKKYEEVKNIIINDNTSYVITDKHEYEARLIVACDGANSIVRKLLGLRKPKIYLGIITNIKKRYNDCIKVFFNKYFSPDFFSWHIPFKGEYGLITSVRPKNYFNYFKEILGLDTNNMIARPIPIGIVKTYARRCIFVGDAASQVKPLTGGGIIYGLKSALHAIKCIRNAIEKRRYDEKMLFLYEKAWKRELGCEMKLQLFVRKRFRYMKNRQIDRFIQDFKKDFEKIKNFDYDKITSIIFKLSKIKLFKHIILNYL